MNYVIEIEGLTKKYPNGFTAVSDLSLNVSRGVFGFLGPNGAGKTTTIEILVGAMKPTSGSVRILGHDIQKEAIEVKRRIGYLPENPGFYENMSGLRFLRFMGELHGLTKSKASEKAKELLTWIGLDGWAGSSISQYSTGMKQRLGLAQSLVNDPDVVFLDEPTANLDPFGRADIVERVRNLAGEGKTVFVSTHILSEIEQMADHIAIINNGELVVQGSIQDLTRSKEARRYRIDVSEPETFKNELETRGFVVSARLIHGQIYIETRDDEKLWTEVPKIASQHKMQLRAFDPIRTDLQTIYLETLEKARIGVKR